MPNIGSKSPFTDEIMQFSDLTEGELHLSTYATVLLVLIILKELPELAKLFKESSNDRIIALIAKILGFAANYLRTFWETKDKEERLHKQKEKINALLESLDLFAEVPAEMTAASEELDGQLEKHDKIVQSLAEKMQAANDLLTQYRTDLAALRAQHIEALLAKIAEQKISLSTAEKESLRTSTQTQHEILIAALQALASQEKQLTKESLHELTDKQLTELLKKSLRRDTLTGIELRVFHLLITNFAATNMRAPKINELRTSLKALDDTFTKEQKDEAILRKNFEEKIAVMGDGMQKTAQEATTLNGLPEERLVALTKVITPAREAEELVN